MLFKNRAKGFGSNFPELLVSLFENIQAFDPVVRHTRRRRSFFQKPAVNVCCYHTGSKDC